MATFILTAVGDDRAGLVSDLAAPINAHGASWERSQMSRLAGKFAGIIEVEVAARSLDALVADLQALGSEDVRITVYRPDGPAEPAGQRFHLDLLGADHPGIVAEISASLAAAEVSIEELSTDLREAPMAGGTLFEAHAVLAAPASADADQLGRLLEGLADELMVEIRLSEG